MLEGEELEVLPMTRCHPSCFLDLGMKVIASQLEAGLIDCQQLNQVGGRARGNYVVHRGLTVRVPSGLSQLVELLLLNHEVIRWNEGALISFVPQLNCTNSMMVFPEEYAGFVPKQRCLIFEYQSSALQTS